METLTEPSGLFAIVSGVSKWIDEPDETYRVYYVKAPTYIVDELHVYWFMLGSEHGWSWEQITNQNADVRVDRAGIEKAAS